MFCFIGSSSFSICLVRLLILRTRYLLRADDREATRAFCAAHSALRRAELASFELSKQEELVRRIGAEVRQLLTRRGVFFKGETDDELRGLLKLRSIVPAAIPLPIPRLPPFSGSGDGMHVHERWLADQASSAVSPRRLMGGAHASQPQHSSPHFD